VIKTETHGLHWREMQRMYDSEPTQETTPAKGEPVEIPIPTREEVFRDLGNVAKPRKTPPSPDEKTAAGEPSALALAHTT
jgi:hypothetical protein